MKGTIRKRGETWTYQFQVPDPRREGARRTISKGGFRLRREAETALAEALVGFDDNAHVEPTKVTLRQYLTEEWLPSLRNKPSTVQGYSDQVSFYVLPHLGHVKLRDLTTGDLVRLYSSLRESGRRKGGGGLSESSLTKVHITLSKALNDAVESGLIARSPMARLPKRVRPAAGRAEKRPRWSTEEVARFLAHVDGDRLSAMYRLVLATGLRRSEVAGLRWEAVDVDAGTMSVNSARVSVNYAVQEGVPKSNRSRNIALGLETVATLRSHRRGQLEERMAWGPAWTDSGYLFTAEDGSPLHPQRLPHLLKRHAVAAGVPVIPFHSLRHTCASGLLRQGVPVWDVSRMLGHASIAITIDTYNDDVDGATKAVAAAADAWLGSSADNVLTSLDGGGRS